MVDNKQLWGSVLNEIEVEVTRPTFVTWFNNTHILKQEDGIVSVGVPNEFVKDWLFNKYHKLILKLLREISDGVRGVEYVISKEKEAPAQEPELLTKTNTENGELL